MRLAWNRASKALAAACKACLRSGLSVIISLGEVIIDKRVLKAIVQDVGLKLLLPGQDVAIGLF